MKLKYNIMYRSRVIGLGISIGNDYTVKKKWKNFFIEIDFLIWTCSLELKW